MAQSEHNFRNVMFLSNLISSLENTEGCRDKENDTTVSTGDLLCHLGQED